LQRATLAIVIASERGLRRQDVVGWALVLLFALATAMMAVTPVVAAEPEAPEPSPHVVIFYSASCPHCHAELEFLQELASEYPDLRIVAYEVSGNAANRELMVETLTALGHRVEGVPTTIIDGEVWVGFGPSSRSLLRAAAVSVMNEEQSPGPGEPSGAAEESAEPTASATVIDVPLFGDVDVGQHSLVVATTVIALVDGFNPCSLWALSILLALVLNTGSRRRVMAVGLTFLVITTALYGVYIVGLYSVLSYIGYLSWIRLSVAALALTIGAINVKDYFAFKQGVSLTISERHKPKLYQRMRSVADPSRPLLPVLGGTAALAVGVSLIETPCTAGFPVLWADLLAEQSVAFAGAAALFALYMLVFLLDELAVLALAVVAMRVTKVTERHGRVLKLVGGVVMITLAGALVFTPEAMESVGGAITVVVVAAAITAAVLIGDRLLRPPGRSGTARSSAASTRR
jgi:cytochrome c biogenesis protein CcdA/thiol-disulfide isomerase/thioredoxin